MVLLAAAEVRHPFCQSPLHELWPHSDAICSLLQSNTLQQSHLLKLVETPVLSSIWNEYCQA